MVNRPRGHQSHFDPAPYLGTIRTEVPAYNELQDAVADATAGIQAERVLELGVGTGETSRRVLDLHPDAELVGIDESAEMLAAASINVAAADLRVSRLGDALPEGNFDMTGSYSTSGHSPRSLVGINLGGRIRSRTPRTSSARWSLNRSPQDMYLWTAVDGATVVGSVNCKCATDAGVKASSLHTVDHIGVALELGEAAHDVFDSRFEFHVEGRPG
jgi:SAM-dependent methyltransferase